MLEVVEAGPLLTLQDAGRAGLAHLGVPPSGAADAWGLRVANALADAPDGAAALEVTLGACTLRAVETCVVAIGGADLGAERDDGLALRPDAAHRLPAGALVRFAGAVWGVRAYVGLAGGIATDPVMGSASTYGPGGLGFAGGRPLRPGDRFAPRRPGDMAAAGRAWPTRIAPHPATCGGPLAFVPGPDQAAAPPDALGALARGAWTVSPASDRMGMRILGPSLGSGREIASHPLLPGAVQVPPDGHPIVLLVDGPTIGGYPVVGVVAAADLPRLGQLGVGDEVRLEPVSAADARDRLRAQRERFSRGLDALHADSLWHRLADHAGA